jgi:chemotaxis family two-component system response regulator Rcp1
MSYKSQAMEILVVEDQYAYCELIKDAIQSGGIRSNIHIITDGAEALQFLYKEDKYKDAPTPDFILLDLHLPGKSGIEILEKIKTDPVLNLMATPVIILSNSDNPNQIKKAYDLYANAYVLKTSDAKEFLDNFRKIEAFWMNIARLPSDDFF